MSIRFDQDPRIVMTLDAGGTGLKFSAIRGNKTIAGPIVLPSEADNLERCLGNIIAGFEQMRASLPAQPVAISFAFPGPADYPNGIIANIGNLPAFRGGVALGPALQERFGIPVYINNDGDLFAYGEAIAGFLPEVNQALEKAGSPKRYKNLLGLTLGTGLGGGIVRNGELFIGDNSAGGEVWLSRNKLAPEINAEEGASIRAVRRVYAKQTGIPFEQAPEPKDIYAIGMGEQAGNREAAKEAFRQLGEVAGDVAAQALTLIDGLVVVGGGISAAHPLYLDPLVGAMNGVYERNGDPLRRLIPHAFNFENDAQRSAFLTSEVKQLTVPGTTRTVSYDPTPRTAAGTSRLGTSHAVAIGAYAFALNEL